jgi:hypothetical protein
MHCREAPAEEGGSQISTTVPGNAFSKSEILAFSHSHTLHNVVYDSIPGVIVQNQFAGREGRAQNGRAPEEEE